MLATDTLNAGNHKYLPFLRFKLIRAEFYIRPFPVLSSWCLSLTHTVILVQEC